MSWRVGFMPMPVYLLLLASVAALCALGELSAEVTVMIGALVVGGFTCAELGKRIPLLNRIGGPSLVCIFLPSFLVAHQLLPANLVERVTSFTKTTNFIYLFISAVVVGSILSMDRRALVQGFARIFIPLALGSVAGMLVGGAVGAICGIGFWRSILYVVAPVMAGGVGEGAIPLSVGYAQALGGDAGEILGRTLPLVFFGNLVAIICCGALNTLGKRYPQLTGFGRLQVGGDDLETPTHDPVGEGYTTVDVSTVAAGGVTAVSIYLLGFLVHKWIGLPAPVAMLFLVVILKILRAVPLPLEEGARVVFRFFVVAVTYPLMFAMAITSTPWGELVAAFHPANLATVIATVTTLTATGFFVARYVKLHPIDTAIVNACHSGLGGTGDIMILNAAERLQLMPFAQVATRLGGALCVTLAILAMSHFKVR